LSGKKFFPADPWKNNIHDAERTMSEVKAGRRQKSWGLTE
jgi:hypothetical protein